MVTPPPERPRYSTGFRIWIGGLALVALAVVVGVWVSEPLGIGLGVVGAIPAIWFKYPSDRRRTWPDDFPLTARLLGGQPDRRFTGSVYDDSERAWTRLSPRRRLTESTLMGLLAAGVVAYAIFDPGAFFDGFRPRAWLALAVVPLLLWSSFARGRAALRDLRRAEPRDV